MSKPAPLVISASQIDNFLDCPRKWWFQRVLKLKEVQKGYFTFGTVLHGCIERWMAADKQGRVPYDILNPSIVPEPLKGQIAGTPVDVFPPGWETIEERGAKVSVTPNEARLIRRLFTEAVERGIITRDEGVTVEREIHLPVLEGVELTGYIDLHKAKTDIGKCHNHDKDPSTEFYIVPEIHDHKSFGESSTRYLKQPGPKDSAGNLIPIEHEYTPDDGTSPNSVGHNQQVLTYAAATSIIDDYDGPVIVRHNQFPKFEDPKGVRKVEALVSPNRLKSHWAFIQATARRMLLVQKIKEWKDTPGPETTDTCSKYGGCPFQGICGKRETPEVYSRRVDRLLASSAKRTRPNLTLTPRKRKGKPGGTMNETSDIFARAAAQQTARRGGAAAAPAAKPANASANGAVAAAKRAAQAPAVNSAPAPAVQAVAGGAPWGDPKCPACKGYGINSKGRACPICDRTAPKRGVPPSSMYELALADDGTVTAVALNDAAVEQLGADTAWAGEVPKAGAAPVAQPKAAPVAAPTPEEVAEVEDPAVEPVPAPVAAPVPARRGPGRPRKDGTPAQPRAAQGASAPAAPVAAPAPAAQPVAAPAEASGRSGRPKLGCTVLIGCVQLSGPERPTMLASALLETVGAQLAADMGATSYWTLDPFKRRERLRERGAQIAESLGRTILLVGSTNDPDVVSLVNGLTPHADMVIEGLR